MSARPFAPLFFDGPTVGCQETDYLTCFGADDSNGLNQICVVGHDYSYIKCVGQRISHQVTRKVYVASFFLGLLNEN